MDRPDATTLACVNSECHLYGQTGQGNLMIRKVYGRGRTACCAVAVVRMSFRATRYHLFNTKLSDAKAGEVIDYFDEGYSLRGTARLTKGSKASAARLLKASGCHAQQFQDRKVQDLTPRTLEFDEQWSFVKKSRKIASSMSPMISATVRIIRWGQWIAN